MAQHSRPEIPRFRKCYSFAVNWTRLQARFYSDDISSCRNVIIPHKGIEIEVQVRKSNTGKE